MLRYLNIANLSGKTVLPKYADKSQIFSGYRMKALDQFKHIAMYTPEPTIKLAGDRPTRKTLITQAYALRDMAAALGGSTSRDGNNMFKFKQVIPCTVHAIQYGTGEIYILFPFMDNDKFIDSMETMYWPRGKTDDFVYTDENPHHDLFEDQSDEGLEAFTNNQRKLRATKLPFAKACLHLFDDVQAWIENTVVHAATAGAAAAGAAAQSQVTVPIVPCGHSMGAYLALAFTEYQQNKKQILYAHTCVTGLPWMSYREGCQFEPLKGRVTSLTMATQSADLARAATEGGESKTIFVDRFVMGSSVPSGRETNHIRYTTDPWNNVKTKKKPLPEEYNPARHQYPDIKLILFTRPDKDEEERQISTLQDAEWPLADRYTASRIPQNLDGSKFDMHILEHYIHRGSEAIAALLGLETHGVFRSVVDVSLFCHATAPGVLRATNTIVLRF